jgi:hypothetical protein
MNIMNSRFIFCIAALSISAVAMSADPTSATPPSTPATLGSAAAPQLPTVVVEKSDLQAAAGEKVESSEIREIRQALSELLALEEVVGSIEQIQEKKATLKAAVERGVEQDPKRVLRLLFGFEYEITNWGSGSSGPYITDQVRSFIQRDPELAIALIDQVTYEYGRIILVKSIGSNCV